MANILFLVGNPANLVPGHGDQVLYDRMVAAGHTVTVRDDGDANTSIAGFHALVESESIASSATAPYLNIPIGVVVLENGAWDTEHDLMIGSSTALTSVTVWNVLDGDHPIAELAGLPAGDITAASSAASYRYLNATAVPASAHMLAALGSGGTTQVVAWTFEAGDLLADSTPAPGRRVGFGLPTGTAPSAAEAVLDLFDAAVAWAAGENPDTDPPPGGPAVRLHALGALAPVGDATGPRVHLHALGMLAPQLTVTPIDGFLGWWDAEQGRMRRARLYQMRNGQLLEIPTDY